MISTTSAELEPMGSHRLGMASSDTATITALPASSTGMPAAISAPNTAISRISVIGTEVSSALWKSWLITVLAAWSVLASPASRTSRPGWLACTRATAARSALTVLSALAFGPATWNVTRAVRPSAEISTWPPGLSGDRMSAAARGSRCSALTTSATAPRSAGSCTYVRPGPVPRAWMSTLSAGGVTTPSLLSICSAWPDWPGSYCGWLCVPSRCPPSSATTASTSQPAITATRCRALQHAIRCTIGPCGRRPPGPAHRDRAHRDHAAPDPAGVPRGVPAAVPAAGHVPGAGQG